MIRGIRNNFDWKQEKHELLAKLEPMVTDRLTRAGAAKWHPVYDFLFEYYPYRPAHLMRYSPGSGIVLQGARESELDWQGVFVAVEQGFVIPANSFPSHRNSFLEWVFRYLTKIAQRPPLFGCFGLHEWAMVYECDAVRYPHIPFRLSKTETSRVVESMDLRCTHFDAFRFFTSDARPRNKTQLTRAQTEQHDQRGCVHVTMDLYKFAHKIAPWCGSTLVTETFLLAAKAREIDMRASPYDLREFGFPAIEIETRNGQEEYIKLQRQLAEDALPLRSALIAEYRYLLESRKGGACPEEILSEPHDGSSASGGTAVVR